MPEKPTTNMKCMIFAAGLGTRLRPLTLNTPKALVEINGVSLLEINIRRLISLFGVTEIIINTHHFPEKIEAFLKEKNNFGIRIETSYEKGEPLETGGGLKKAAWFFDNGKPFFICNADILCTIDLNKMLAAHKKSKALVTYAVQKRDTSRYMLHDKTMRMCGWMSVKQKKIILGRRGAVLDMYSFSCFHVVDPNIFKTFPEKDYFTIIDWYLDICGKNKIMGYNHVGDAWCDIGTLESLKDAAQQIDLFFSK